ncbi:plasmid pRiA4b ORF-3 family protein [Pseudarthrobacter sp. NS4]|uniref:plasmid pRiA4b ORF-3 family protein n=1 Tax=Pseudarthrobacter sp. NS4 TaxID=2973976 RepID=UPI002161BF16|nr:plasmid pRiA4b ORF-3 family protein [Pseudarthrobacter sp. NS4]
MEKKSEAALDQASSKGTLAHQIEGAYQRIGVTGAHRQIVLMILLGVFFDALEQNAVGITGPVLLNAVCSGLGIRQSLPPARLIDGARRGPLEDSRGFAGYEEIMDALADPSHPDHAEHSAWVADITGSDAPFDPAFLDIPAVNRVLAEHF